MTARALTARPARFFIGAGSTALALALGGVPLMLTASAHAAPQNNAKGSLTVHALGSVITDQNNEPHVCQFTLVADNYAATDTGITYSFSRIAPSTPQADGLLPGSITLVGGAGETGVLSLPNGHYKPHGQIAGTENGADNFKAFWVDCGDTGGTTGDTSTSGSSSSGGSGTDGGSSTSTDGGSSTSTDGGSSTSTDGGSSTSTDGGSSTSTDGGSSTSTDGGSSTSTDGGSSTSTSGSGSGSTGGEAATTGFTGGGSGGQVSVPVTHPVTHPVTRPATRGGGTVTGAKELPFTGSNTRTLALWGLASLMGGVGFCSLGQRTRKQAS